ncbi:MAG: phage GP46 family protein [Phenylobacterium sp.]|nr:phage GP46 family protein [Phenylobacterium sp.]
MPDISTFWSPGESRGDWAVAGFDLASGTDLETAVLISLFTDRRADPDDVIPDGSGDPRGWWGDALGARPLGSKLWLLERAKQTEDTRQRAQGYAEDALAWLVEDGVAAEVVVAASWQGPGFLGLQVTISEPDGRQTAFNYQWAWKAVS